MLIPREHLLQLGTALNACPNLMSLHLSDNGIRIKEGYAKEVLDSFGIYDCGLLPEHEHDDTCILKETPEFVNPKAVSTEEILDRLDKAHLLKVQDTCDKANTLELKKEQFGQKRQKEELLKQFQAEQVQNHKLALDAQQSGVARTQTSINDKFILTRMINRPELIFNHGQGPAFAQQNDTWNLVDECFICSQHRYTMIFFNKGVLDSTNPDLVEIKDKAFVAKLKEEYQADPQNKNVFTPVIRGTVTSGFKRQLRMMTTEIFALLSVADSSAFVPTIELSNKLKKAVVSFVETDRTDVLHSIGLFDKLEGWRDILVDKCFYNELTDL